MGYAVIYHVQTIAIKDMLNGGSFEVILGQVTVLRSSRDLSKVRVISAETHIHTHTHTQQLSLGRGVII